MVVGRASAFAQGAVGRVGKVSDPLIEVMGIGRDFGGVRAVDTVTFSTGAASIVGLIGPNGAGKSTLLGMLAGGLKPTRGRIIFRGKDITGWEAHRIARMGIRRTFQIAGMFDRLTVLENLIMGGSKPRGEGLISALRGPRRWGAEEEAFIARARGVLERFGMLDLQDRYAAELSGGQRRLVEIMRAVVGDACLLLLDEPMAGVNRVAGRRIEEVLCELRGEGVGMIMVEHELGAVERTCDRVLVLARGRILGDGPMSSLREDKEVQRAYLGG